MILTPYQVSGVLAANGMPASRIPEFVAVAFCESGYNTDAISGVGAIGPWQIMPFNAGIGGGTVADLYDPLYNAKVCVIMSGHGSNCAAWDSCYRDIYHSGRYAYLNWPEPGSCVHGHLGSTAVVTGGGRTAHTKPPSYPGISDTLDAAVVNLSATSGRTLPALAHQATQAGARARSMYKPRWRP